MENFIDRGAVQCLLMYRSNELYSYRWNTSILDVQLYSTFAPAADTTKFGQLSDGVTRAALLRQLGSDTEPRTCNTVR